MWQRISSLVTLRRFRSYLVLAWTHFGRRRSPSCLVLRRALRRLRGQWSRPRRRALEGGSRGGAWVRLWACGIAGDGFRATLQMNPQLARPPRTLTAPRVMAHSVPSRSGTFFAPRWLQNAATGEHHAQRRPGERQALRYVRSGAVAGMCVSAPYLAIWSGARHGCLIPMGR